MDKTFKVCAMEVHKQEYFVKAESEEEAKQKVLDGGCEEDGVIVDENSFEYVSSVTDFSGKPISVELIHPLSFMIDNEGLVLNDLNNYGVDKVEKPRELAGKIHVDGEIELYNEYAAIKEEVVEMLVEYIMELHEEFEGLPVDENLRNFIRKNKN